MWMSSDGRLHSAAIPIEYVQLLVSTAWLMAMPADELGSLANRLDALDVTEGTGDAYDGAIEESFVAEPVPDSVLQAFFRSEPASYLRELENADPRWALDIYDVLVDLVDAEVDRRLELFEDPEP